MKILSSSDFYQTICTKWDLVLVWGIFWATEKSDESTTVGFTADILYKSGLDTTAYMMDVL